MGREHKAANLDARLDCDLLDAFVSEHDEAAFEALIRRHAGMVRGVCRRFLADISEAEDVTQCVFILLAKKAKEVSKHVSLAGWLHQAALNESRNVRKRRARLKTRERHAGAVMSKGTPDDSIWQDLKPILDEELNAIPREWRETLILHHIEGYSHEDGAKRLNLSVGTFASRISRAREALRDRLSRRGVIVPTVALGALLAHAAVTSEISAHFMQRVALALKTPSVVPRHPFRQTVRTPATIATAPTIVFAGVVLAGIVAVWTFKSQPSTNALQSPPSIAKTTETPTQFGKPSIRNELFNGDFESLNTNGVPTGWSWPASPNIRLEKIGNNVVARLSVDAPDKPRTVVTRLTLNPSWKRLRISARFRVQGLKHGEKSWQNACVNLRFEDSRGQTIGYTGGPQVRADVEWDLATVLAAPPVGAAKLVLEPGVFGDAGTLWVDDIVVTANPEQEAPALPLAGVRLNFARESLRDAGWTAWDPSVAFSALDPGSGDAFLRLASPRHELAGASRWYTLLPGNGLRQLAVSGRARIVRLDKSAVAGTGPCIQLRFMTDGLTGAETRLVSIDARGSQWAPFTSTCSIPKEASTLELMPALIGVSGVVDFDDLELSPKP